MNLAWQFNKIYRNNNKTKGNWNHYGLFLKNIKLSTPMINIFCSFPIRSFFETVYFAFLKCKSDLRIFL
jgi:hypothetical protein